MYKYVGIETFRFESDMKVATTLIQLSSVLTKNAQIDRIQRFITENGLGSNEHLKAALDDAQFNLKWTNENIPIIKDVIKRIQLNGQ